MTVHFNKLRNKKTEIQVAIANYEAAEKHSLQLIRQLMKMTGLTQKDLAELMEVKSVQAIYRVMKEKSGGAAIKYLRRLARKL
jgi:antitoxin component HigA of HigAB toxin-antitoxin module